MNSNSIEALATLGLDLKARKAYQGRVVTACAELARPGEGGSRSAPPGMGFSGATCGGTILSLDAMLNRTTPIILCRMREGLPFAEAMAEVRRAVGDDTDPILDAEGRDTANKLVILANAVLGQPTTLADVPTEGIMRMDPAMLQDAASKGGRVLLLARAEWVGSSYSLSVRPTLLYRGHPLFRLGTGEMGIHYRTELFGRTLIANTARGAPGASTTMIDDLIGLMFEGWQRHAPSKAWGIRRCAEA